MKKIYSGLLVCALAVMMIGGMLQVKGGMKDIELTPGKITNEGNSMKLFPSIASTQATVHFWFDADGYVTLHVFDIQGRVVATDEGQILKAHTIETQIDAQSLQNGAYFARLTHSSGKSMTSKFVVAH
jgi:hypothetical protein